MNRFEAHPKKTLAAVLLVMFAAILAGTELTLSALHDELALEETGNKTYLRYIRLREWPPNARLVYRPPEARFNDPVGPVDENYELRIDKFGFIEPSIVHENADLEIAFIGGSTTECLYVRPKTRFPYLAGRRLEQATGLKINALNAGKSGNHTLHSVLAYLGKIAPRRPEFVVLMHTTNDVGILNSKSTYWNDRPGIEIVLDERQIKRRGPITQFIRRVRDRTVPYTYRVVRYGLDAAGDRISNWAQALRPEPRPTARAETDEGEKDARQAKREKVLREYFEPALRTFVRTARPGAHSRC